jgi:UrcA family protein
MKSFIVMAAFVAAGAFGASAPVRADSEQQRQVVRFEQADLSSPSGLNRIYHRLGEAASIVCGDYQSSELLHSQSFERCMQESVSRAVAQIHDARLTRYHESRTAPGAIPVAALVNAPVARN